MTDKKLARSSPISPKKIPLENKRPQSIQEFTAESDLPLRIAILIDTSNSIRDRFRFEQQAAVDFITSVIRPRQDKAMVVSFDSSAELVSDLSDEPEKLAAAVRSLRPGGGTASTTPCTSPRQAQQDQPRHKGRAVIIGSDGDNQSRVSRDQALERQKPTPIYCISTNLSRIKPMAIR